MLLKAPMRVDKCGCPRGEEGICTFRLIDETENHIGGFLSVQKFPDGTIWCLSGRSFSAAIGC